MESMKYKQCVLPNFVFITNQENSLTPIRHEKTRLSPFHIPRYGTFGTNYMDGGQQQQLRRSIHVRSGCNQ
ncbi:MAG: hypothetical protein EA392_12510, partial [Cryomorphaceae bacterium]